MAGERNGSREILRHSRRARETSASSVERDPPYLGRTPQVGFLETRTFLGVGRRLCMVSKLPPALPFSS